MYIQTYYTYIPKLDNVNSISLDATILAAEGEEYQVICSYLYIEWIE
jgi:hypothetical protein